MSLKIAQLMRQPVVEHDTSWLQKALQAAIELELATIPPYLCGQWALQDQSSVPATLIKGIVLDEMGHLGLACNLLRATGVQPAIFDGYNAIKYPGPLPGGVRPKCDPTFFDCDPNFHVVLGFNDFHSFSKMCMQIEYPEDPVPRPRILALDEEEVFPSIGEFYDAILKAFQTNDGKIPYQTDKQLNNRFPKVFVIDGLPRATEAINRIQKQGEGAPRFPFVDQTGTQLAHFYTFGEIYYERKYVFDRVKETGDWTGNPVTVPAAFKMTPVPLDGYGASAPPEVAECDKIFTQMLRQLDQAWASGDENALGDAIDSMTSLKSKAIALLMRQVPRPDPGDGVYGPQFRKATA
jgi:Ferritin-like